MIEDIRPVRRELEEGYFKAQPVVEEYAIKVGQNGEAKQLLWHSLPNTPPT